LTERAITSAFDLNRAVPGLTVEADSGNAGLPAFSIRGKGQNYGAAAGSVETYFADIPLSAPFQIPTLPPQFFDLQSLQVLKGPQGTLFGRSTTGGAMVLVNQLKSVAPMGRPGRAYAIVAAWLLSYLCASYITGAVVSLVGGSWPARART